MFLPRARPTDDDDQSIATAEDSRWRAGVNRQARPDALAHQLHASLAAAAKRSACADPEERKNKHARDERESYRRRVQRAKQRAEQRAEQQPEQQPEQQQPAATTAASFECSECSCEEVVSPYAHHDMCDLDNDAFVPLHDVLLVTYPYYDGDDIILRPEPRPGHVWACDNEGIEYDTPDGRKLTEYQIAEDEFDATHIFLPTRISRSEAERQARIPGASLNPSGRSSTAQLPSRPADMEPELPKSCSTCDPRCRCAGDVQKKHPEVWAQYREELGLWMAWMAAQSGD